MAQEKPFGDYNVLCVDCDAVYQPRVGTPRWWEAKRRAESGKLDALPIDGKTHGCIRKEIRSDAPFRVFGYDDLGGEYDAPFYSFVKAVKAFREADQYGDMVFISGVSDAVVQKLKWA
jgi:hypothetical protein